MRGYKAFVNEGKGSKKRKGFGLYALSVQTLMINIIKTHPLLQMFRQLHNLLGNAGNRTKQNPSGKHECGQRLAEGMNPVVQSFALLDTTLLGYDNLSSAVDLICLILYRPCYWQMFKEGTHGNWNTFHWVWACLSRLPTKVSSFSQTV